MTTTITENVVNTTVSIGTSAEYVSSAITTHNADTTAVHGIADTSALDTVTARDTAISTHNSLSTAHNLTANISAALSGAASPSAGNVLMTDSAVDALIAAIYGAIGTWTAGQTFQTTITHAPQTGIGHTFRTIDYSAIDANSKNWNENLITAVNSGGGNNNNVWQFGYNNAPGGGLAVAGEAAFYIQMESNYNPAATTHVPTFEYHLNAFTSAGVAINRPFQYNVARDGTWTEVFYNADKYSFNTRTGAQIFILEPGILNLSGATYIRSMVNNTAIIKQVNALANQILNVIYIDGNDITKLDETGGVSLAGTGKKVGFYGTAPIVKQTGVAVSDAAIHAALVNLGLISA